MATIYVSVADFKTYAGIGVTTDDTLLAVEIEAASRAIDTVCGRSFWVDETTSTRVFRPLESSSEFWFDPFELSTATAATVKVDTTDDGTFDETWTVDVDFIFLNENLVGIGNETKPITGLRLITKSLPVGGYRSRLEVVGKWGWPAVPSAVQEACKLVTNELYARKNAPFGVEGFDNAGVVSSIRESQRTMQLLGRYMRGPRF